MLKKCITPILTWSSEYCLTIEHDDNELHLFRQFILDVVNHIFSVIPVGWSHFGTLIGFGVGFVDAKLLLTIRPISCFNVGNLS